MIDYKKIWKEEEKNAHIVGWDFSYIDGKYHQDELPWEYLDVVREYLDDDKDILDYDTGGGEVLLTLNHPYHKTYVTEGYSPNVLLCQERLIPLGIHFKECNNPSNIPFEDESFDMIINRNGSFDPKEIYRLLKKDGIFITQQVGDENDRDLVAKVLPDLPKPFPHLNLKDQSEAFKDAGFSIIRGEETFKETRFFDMSAFVWFACIIEWEFEGFSVEKCYDELLKLQKEIDEKGYISGTIHRYLLVVRKEG